jgi:hypothetical protein
VALSAYDTLGHWYDFVKVAEVEDHVAFGCLGEDVGQLPLVRFHEGEGGLTRRDVDRAPSDVGGEKSCDARDLRFQIFLQVRQRRSIGS